MFDIGFWELVVIFIVGIIVIGPEKLPSFVRDITTLYRKIRRFVRDTRRDLESELSIHETKNIQESLTDLEDLMRDPPDKRPGYKPLKPENSKTGEGTDQQEKPGDHGC